MNLNIYDVEDQPAAQKEIDCIMDCSMMLEVHLEKGNFTKALDLTQDMSRSVEALRRLIKEKETNSQVNSIAVKLISLGIDASVVYKYFDNKKAE